MRSKALQSQPDVSLEDLMHAYQQSDVEAGGLLVDRLSPQLLQYFLGQSRNRAEAEDVLQDFWLRIHKARATFRSGEPLLPWLYAIARRVWIDHYRKSKRVRQHELLSEQLPDAPAKEPPPRVTPEINELLRSLPQSQRETLLMLKVSGLSLEEVARATGTSVGAAKQKVHRAYETLRRVLKKQQ